MYGNASSSGAILFVTVVVILFLGMLAATIHFIKRAFATKSVTSIFLATIFTIIFLFVVIVLRAYLLPGGEFHDSMHQADKAYLRLVQEYLEKYKASCKAYPTTEQGLKALVEKPLDADCPNYKSMMRKPFVDLKYSSDGKIYEIETTRQRGNSQIFAKATDSMQPFTFKREIEHK